jgi:hypothetical protein
MHRAVARTLVAAALSLSFSACAAVSRPSTTPEALQADGVAARREHAAIRDSIVARLARRAVRRGDRTLDLLLLSGGGQHGAFGVGFLRGWSSRSTDAMPTFDLVSGISTGALQAPYALLGTPAALDTIAALYREAADRIAPTFDWWFWLRRTGGLVKTGRYERSIAGAVDDAMRARLRAQFAQDRQLLIATTDMDLGVGRIWDLARELGSSDSSLARTRTLLYTATAIPGIFPPRVIDGHVHSDGGIISNILPLLGLDEFRALARSLREQGVTDDVSVRVWVVMNVWTHAPLEAVKPSSRGGLSGRSTELLFWSSQPQALQRLQELSLAVSAGVPGLRMEVHVTQPAASLALEPGAGKLFDKAWMARLEQIGFTRAQGSAPWDSVTSSYERPAPR